MLYSRRTVQTAVWVAVTRALHGKDQLTLRAFHTNTPFIKGHPLNPSIGEQLKE